MADPINHCERAPLSTEDRIRAILGIRGGGPLPKVDTATMLRYYGYLSKHLTLPCNARYSSTDGTISFVKVAGLVHPETMLSDSQTGLRCMAHHQNKAEIVPLVDIEVGHDSPNFQFLEEYWFWLWNWCDGRPHRPSKPR